MKKIFILRIILLLVGLGFQVSCSDYLELIPPSGLVREEFWTSKEDVEAVMMGAYQTFATLNKSLFTYGEARGDMVAAGYNLGSNEKNLMESNIFPDNKLCNWSVFYKVINYCNEVLKNAPEVQKTDNTFTDFQLKGLMSEAIWLRSLNYFYLVRLFKDVPLFLNPSENDAVDFYLPLTKGEEVLQVVLNDLNEYRPFATDGYKTMEEVKGRATKAAFDALLADIALWTFDYTACIEYCKRLTEESSDEITKKSIDLLPGPHWFELFYPGNSLESIFEIQFDSKNNQSNSLYYITYPFFNYYFPSKQAIELFSRKTALEITRGEDASIYLLSTDNYFIWKFIGKASDGKSMRSSSDRYNCNWIIYRLADVYLMQAEALSQLERFTEAAEILNMIRNRANIVPLELANSATVFEDAILDERARELAFEGKRWFDLLRMGRRNNYARKDKLVEMIIKNVPSTQKRILGSKLTNPLGWYLPIYKGEIERNKNLVQNPYYIY